MLCSEEGRSKAYSGLERAGCLKGRVLSSLDAESESACDMLLHSFLVEREVRPQVLQLGNPSDPAWR